MPISARRIRMIEELTTKTSQHFQYRGLARADLAAPPLTIAPIALVSAKAESSSFIFSSSSYTRKMISWNTHIKGLLLVCVCILCRLFSYVEKCITCYNDIYSQIHRLYYVVCEDPFERRYTWIYKRKANKIRKPIRAISNTESHNITFADGPRGVSLHHFTTPITILSRWRHVILFMNSCTIICLRIKDRDVTRRCWMSHTGRCCQAVQQRLLTSWSSVFKQT